MQISPKSNISNKNNLNSTTTSIFVMIIKPVKLHLHKIIYIYTEVMGRVTHLSYKTKLYTIPLAKIESTIISK